MRAFLPSRAALAATLFLLLLGLGAACTRAPAATDAGGGPGVDATAGDSSVPTDDASGADAGTDAGSAGGILPSGGSGGAYPGAETRTTSGPGTGPFDYYLYVPTAYDPATAIPLVSVFHGQGDTGSSMRDFWSATAEANGFMVLATSNTGAMGGWDPAIDGPRYNAALADAVAAYNVEQARHYLWGFSAGGHLAHGLGLTNTDVFAAYAVSAGILDAFAGGGAPAAAARNIPVSIHIGDADPLLPYAQTDHMRFMDAGWVDGVDLDYVEFAGPHTVYESQLQEIWDFLAPWTLP
jgi:dienelactone hydrolase